MHENCLKSDFRLRSLSEQAGVSHRYFEQLFKQRYSISPKEYVLNLKIKRAKELLLDADKKIKDIALELGYGDIYHFGKLFLKKRAIHRGNTAKSSIKDNPLLHK